MPQPRVLSLLFLLCAVPTAGLSAPRAPTQDGPPQILTLDQAIQYASDHYPAVRAALERANASAAGVDVARAAYLPRLDSIWQSSRGTANNIVGPLLPQSVIPSLTGPVFPSASSQSVWSSAVGALLSWEPFDLGLRRATVAGARAGLTQARAAETLTRLDVQRAAADAFLDVIAAQRTVLAAESDLDRRQLLLRSVATLVHNELRPGVDASRAEAERAAARTRVIQSHETLAIAEAALGRVLGISGAGGLVVSGDRLLARLPPTDIPLPAASAHPLARERQAAVDRARAEEDVLARTDRPRIFLQSGVFARGSGASADGVLDPAVGGLRLDRANWAAGVQVVLPNLFDFASLRARKAEAAASERASAASYDEALLSIDSEQRATAAMLQAARAIAANTPVQLEAAREAETRAHARYDAGLAPITEVADTQSLLAQAEAQDQLARVGVWRALVAAAAAGGDLSPLVDLARQQ